MKNLNGILKKYKSLSVVMCAIIGTVIIFVVVVILYFYKFDSILVKENEAHLAETAEQITSHTLSIVESTKISLQITADAIVSIENKEQAMNYLKNVENKIGLAYIGYAGLDGILLTSDTTKTEDISKQDYFLKALSGETVITDLHRKILQDKAVSGVLIVVPMNDGSTEETLGVLVAMLDIKRLQNVLNISSFDGNGYTYLIDTNGELVLRSKSMDYNNFYMVLQNVTFTKGYSYEKTRSDMESNRSGMTLYNNMGTEQYAYYCPLGFNNWTLINIVAKDAATANTAILIRELAILSIVAIVVFVCLVTLAIILFNISENRRRSTEMKSIFLANMSHELRTPMNAIVGASELLQRETLTDTQRNYVHVISNSGKGLLGIINDILDFSKIEFGKFTFVEKEYSVFSLIMDITTIVVIQIGEKPVRFFVDFDRNLPAYLLGDVVRVKQILVNLLGNAVKFTEKGIIRLSIQCSKIDDKIKLDMIVSDTGIGIRKKNLEHLFVSFNQLDTHHHHTMEGTGLGLAISKHLAKAMSGDITVESTYDIGSTFIATIYQVPSKEELLCEINWPTNTKLALYAPDATLKTIFQSILESYEISFEIFSAMTELKKAVLENHYQYVLADRDTLSALPPPTADNPYSPIILLNQNEQYSSNSKIPTIYTPLLSFGMAHILKTELKKEDTIYGHFCLDAITPYPYARILIVDDNELNLEITQALLSPYQMEIDCKTSGFEAVDAVKSIDYNLVFMDHMMPEMDGVEALKCIRALPDEKRRLTPIVVLTANATRQAQEMFFAEGFDDFLAKPLEPDLLDNVLRKYLD